MGYNVLQYNNKVMFATQVSMIKEMYDFSLLNQVSLLLACL